MLILIWGHSFFRAILRLVMKDFILIKSARKLISWAIHNYGQFVNFWKNIQTGEHPMLARLRELNWQTSGKKTDLFERKILLSHY